MSPMLPVAIVLLVIIALFVVGVVISNPQSVTLNIFVAQIPTNLAVVFIVGAVTAAALVAALALLGAGIRRQRAISRAVKASPASVKGSPREKDATTGTSSRRNTGKDASRSELPPTSKASPSDSTDVNR